MKNYLQILRRYKISFLLSPLLVLILVLSETAQPMLMARIVDDGVMQQDIPFITRFGLYMIGITLVGLVASIANIYVSSKASIGFGTDLRSSLFRRIQEFSFSDIDEFSPASLITRLTNDITRIQMVVQVSLRLLLRSPLMLILALFFVSRINTDLLWILAVSVPALALSLYIILRVGFPFFIKVQEKLDQLNAVIQENLINIRVVKSFVREDFETRKFVRSSEDLKATVIRASNIVVTMFPVLQLVMNASILAVLWFGGRKIMTGDLKVGELISVVTYLSQILFSLMMLSMIIMTFARASASSKRIREVLDKEPSLTDTPTGAADKYQVERGDVVFNNVNFRYRGGETDVLRGITFHVSPAETVAVVGATGSAKSSLIQLIPRLYDIRSGEILIDGHNIKDYHLETLREGVGVVLQKNVLFSGTIRENLLWGDPHATQEQIEEAARVADAHDFILSFPQGYDTPLERGGVNVSGGQKQRLCIARALLRRPKILILDDSTSAVDSNTELRIRTNLKKLLTDTTVFIITQRINTMQTSDKVMILDDGEIVAMGTPAQLMQSSEVYREIYNSQQIVP